MNIKITLVNLSRANSISQEVNQADECLSLETMDLSDKIDNWPIIEIAVRIISIIFLGIIFLLFI